jgi:hypothetical protein
MTALCEHWFILKRHARQVIEEWRCEYDQRKSLWDNEHSQQVRLAIWRQAGLQKAF